MLHQFLLVWVSARLVRHTYSELHSLTSFERHTSIFHPKTTIALEYYRVNSIAIGWLLHKVAVLNYCTPTSIWMNNQDSIATAYSFTSNYLCCYLSPSGVVYSVRIVLKYSAILASSTATPPGAGYWAIANCIKRSCRNACVTTWLLSATIQWTKIVSRSSSSSSLSYSCFLVVVLLVELDHTMDDVIEWLTSSIQRDQQNIKSDPPWVHLWEYTGDGLLLLCPL